MLLEDLLEQEKREQQQQHPIPTAAPTSTATNLPPGAHPISSLSQEQSGSTDPSMVTMNPTMVTGQIVPNQPVGGTRPQVQGQLQTLQPQRPPSATTVQAFIPRNGPPGAFPASQLPPNHQRMVNPRQPGPVQQSWPPRHPQEVTLQQRGPGASSVPQGSMMPMQVPPQQQTQMPGVSISGPQMGAPQQIQAGLQTGTEPHSAIRPGLVSTTGASTPPPALSNTPAPPTPPENPQTDEDRLKVCNKYF